MKALVVAFVRNHWGFLDQGYLLPDHKSSSTKKHGHKISPVTVSNETPTRKSSTTRNQIAAHVRCVESYWL